jgi:arylsulfatase B
MDAPLPPNVLVVVIDDVSVDQISTYGFADGAPTPTIDALADRGLRFDQAWATPVCSPTRAALLTGRLPVHNGVGTILFADRAPYELPLDEVTVPELLALAPQPYLSAALGKWHLGTASAPSGTAHPLAQGFDLFSGTTENLRQGDTYGSYENIGFDGGPQRAFRFSTTAIVDDALFAHAALEEPWFLYVAFHAAHIPLTTPPEALLDGFDVGGRGGCGAPPPSEHRLYQANLVAADHELGRLLAGLGDDLDRTLVVVVGDNGTATESQTDEDRAEAALQGGKGSFLEGSLRVPFVVAGPPVTARGSTQALVHVVDLLPTLGELAGAPEPPNALDGRSLVPLLSDPSAWVHEVVYTETRWPQAPPWTAVDRAIRDDAYKIVDDHDERSYWRIDGFVDEEVDLATATDAERARFAALEAALLEHPLGTDRLP